ncbi:alanine--tRNA ligase, mitochondrial isoform X2 [Boleophthalmus pectinirostris]|uniref:alanine--tRNA ligase, mitochondrial isoform X2 n=1 Tax=Boleophthalmus pectinirostris TaxID=150288 RepID=UPI00242A4D00|nr:alanine--tRNA ligase, mitochondrial isoform X2 [Boleophthalmus pectinirostris]
MRLLLPPGARVLRTLRTVRALCSGPPPRTAAQIRSDFIEFYRARGHELVPSSPVRPRADPSLLFVNAGMNQFKPLLLGSADPRSPLASLRRVVNSQKCVRAGGKHNDLDDVGKDSTHHTFFEMMGSWSFGDYFKAEACSMAWTLLTEVFQIPKDRLYVSYFSGDPKTGLPPDLETRDVWLQLGLPPDRVLPFGPEQNFWEMGDTGPCGPCTEIHVDLRGGRDAAPLVNTDCPQVLEVWNLVFMEYNRQEDGSLWPLPLRSVDTGLGLERLVSVLQNKTSNYDTDLFLPLILHLHQLSGAALYSGGPGLVDMAYRVVVDHVRTLAVCIADGVHPGMSGAELVLRRILRRAVRFCLEVLKAPEGTLGRLVPTVAHSLGGVYPELWAEQQRIVDVIDENEEQFVSSLRQGTRLIHRTTNKMEAGALFPASVAWSLHRDLGFPLDLVDLVLSERGVRVDLEELDRIRARNQVASDSPRADDVVTLDVATLSELQRRRVPHTDESPVYKYYKHDGKYVFPSCPAQILALVSNRTLVDQVSEGLCGLILDRTCFYSEKGGQSPDRGYLSTQEVVLPLSDVTSCGGYVLHVVQVSDLIRTGDRVQLHLDQATRLSLMRNHTGTHLLNFVLRRVLGSSVHQRGSHVSVERLRFDYSAKSVLSVPELLQVDLELCDLVQRDLSVFCENLSLKSALSLRGVRTVDEVYPDPVRVVSLGRSASDLLQDQDQDQDQDCGTSVELCCGTHVLNSSDLQDVLVVSERQFIRGINRILAVTGSAARQAREVGVALEQEVDSLWTRITGSAPDSLQAAQRLAKEVGHLTNEVDVRLVPLKTRRELQNKLKSLQRNCNTCLRKMETRQAAIEAQTLLQKHGSEPGPGPGLTVDLVKTDSLSILVKSVNQFCSSHPGSSVMLLAQVHPGKVLCACQVPKGVASFSASDWARAVCGRFHGNAGGSDLVAKGTAQADDITAVLEWAELYAKGKT